MNINSVPDEARIGLDIRMVPGITDAEVLERLAEIGGADASFTKWTSYSPVWTEPSDPWIAEVQP